MSRLQLGEAPLDLADLSRLLSDRPPKLALDRRAARRVAASRATVEQAAADERVTYGVNTGFGKLAQVLVPPAQLRRLQVNLVRSHAAGVGPALDGHVARLAFA